MILDLAVLQIILDPLGYKVLTVVGDDGMQDTVLGYDVVLDKLLRHCGSDYVV